MMNTHPTLKRISSRGFRIHVARWDRRVMLTARRASDGRTFTASSNAAFEHLAVQALCQLVCGRSGEPTQERCQRCPQGLTGVSAAGQGLTANTMLCEQ